MAEPKQHFYRYTPEDQQSGFNPLVGDVEPDGVYEVRPEYADRFANHPDWTKATKSDYESQDS